MKSIWSTLLISITIALYCGASAHSADIVVTKDTPDNVVLMNRLMVQRIFTRKQTRWSDGREILVFTKPLTSIEHRDFAINVLGMTPYDYQKQLEDQTYSGRATSVIEINTDELMALRVSNHPGSIGYINYVIIIDNKTVVVIDGNTVK